MQTDDNSIAPLARELAAYEREKPRLLREQNGKFAIFKGDDYVDSFSTFDLAYEEGVKRFGRDLFLVKQVLDPEPEQYAPALTLGLICARS